MKSLKANNLFTQDVDSKVLSFYIDSIKSLSDFLDYYLFKNSYDIPYLDKCIELLYVYGEFNLKNKHFFSITVEENEKYIYFTFMNLYFIDNLVVEHTVSHYFSNANYLLKDKTLSFALSKQEINTKTEDSQNMQISNYQKDILSKTHFNKISASEYIQSTAISLIDKVEDLENIEDELETLAMEFETNSNSNILSSIINNLNLYIDIMERLIEFKHLSFALYTLNNFLKNLDLSQVDSKQHQKFSLLFIHLLDDVKQWRKNIFVLQEANDIHYLDSSLLSSCLQIQSIFENKNIQQDDEDDFELF